MSAGQDSLTYRRASLSDYDAVMAIGSIYGGRDYQWSLYKQLVSDDDNYGLVAVDGDLVVGFSMSSTYDGGRTVLKRSGRVREEYRGRGIYHRLEEELDRHTLAHRPRAMYDVFANTEHELRLAGRFLDMGFHEVCRKDMFHMLLNAAHLKNPSEINQNQPVMVREANSEDLKLIFSTQVISRQIFPAGRLFNVYLPYRLQEENIQYLLCERGGAFISLEDPEGAGSECQNQPSAREKSTNQQHQNGSSNENLDPSTVLNVAMVTFYYCYPTPVGFLYYLDPYARKGLSPAHFHAHLEQHLETLRRYFPDQDGKLTVTHDTNISANDITSCLKTFGIVDQMKGQEKTQVMYERDRAAYGLPVKN